jgi:hypothetical protein
MRLTKRRLLATLAPAALLITSVALAADSPPDNSGIVDRATVRKDVASWSTAFQANATKVKKLLDKASAKSDALKVECLQDKYDKLQAAAKLAKVEVDNTASAFTSGDAKGWSYSYVRLSILVEKSTTLTVEAENCVGDEASYIGDTQVGVEIDPNIPDDDGTNWKLPLPDVTMAPEASPFN